MLKKRTISLAISLLMSPLFASPIFATDVETVGDLKVSGMIDNSVGEGVKFPDGNIQTKACSGCAGVVPINLGGTNASTVSEARTNLGVPGLTTTNTFTLDQLMQSNLFVYGNLSLPLTSASAGIIKMGSDNLIHSYGNQNFFAGRGAGNSTLTGGWNTGVGRSVLGVNTSGGYNTGVGSLALMNNTEGGGNSALGYAALYTNTTGSGNIAIGSEALFANQSGSYNTAVGDDALNFNKDGVYNTAVGQGSLYRNTSGNYNTATGMAALGNNETGGLNAAFGQAALYGNTGGSFNTAIGYSTGYTGASGANANTTGSNNTFIGANAGPGVSTQLNNATAIGANALVSQSNSLVLGASGVKVGIGIAAPIDVLDVLGNIRINDKDLILRGNNGDTAHGLGWYSNSERVFDSTYADRTPDGPVLYGYLGGALGTTNGTQKVAMKWSTGGFDFYNFVRARALNSGSTSVCLDSNNTLSACNSDVRMKKDITTLSENMDVLVALSKLRGVIFTWDGSNEKAANMAGVRDIGMIAQEVEAVFPEIVHTNSDGYKSMDYPKLVAFLVEVNKAQQTEINDLRRLMDSLNERLAALEGKR
jgi:hypothetical protein